MGACCAVRESGNESEQPLLGHDPLSLNLALDELSPIRHAFTAEESLEQEWDIVSQSITEQELDRLQDLRDRVRDCGAHAACKSKPLNQQAQTLLRFLRGREGNVTQAEEMFRASLDWRASFGVDERVAAWRQELAEGRTRRARLMRTYGTDKELCLDRHRVPVWLMRMSVGDPAGMVREVGKDILLVSCLARMETMHAHLRRAMFQTGKLVKGCVQVIDIGDYGVHGVPKWYKRMWDAYRVGSQAFKIFDSNYPETTRKIFIVRMGRLTASIYKLVLPLVPQRTQEKMRIFDGQAAAWKTELMEELPEGAELPEFLTCDSVEAFALARPRGGLVPVGGELPPHPVAPTSLASEAKQDNSKLVERVSSYSKASSRCALVGPAFAALFTLVAALTAAHAFALLDSTILVEAIHAR